MLYPVFYLYAFDVLEVLDIVRYHYQLVRNGSTIPDIRQRLGPTFDNI